MLRAKWNGVAALLILGANIALDSWGYGSYGLDLFTMALAIPIALSAMITEAK